MGRKTRLYKYLTVWLVIVMLSAAMSGCGRSAAGAKGGMKIFFALNQMDAFRQTLVDGAAQKAALEGAAFV
ncbi:MAG: hypothetical protein K2O99_09385, partial [Lachnospiraceae bacterium]|nr:hypothetical protein [Lachnospiraceae bacterium]